MNGRALKTFVIPSVIRPLACMGFACFAAAIPAYSQAPGNQAAAAPAGSKADAYYNYAMAHLYSEQAAKFGGRVEYVNKAVARSQRHRDCR